MSLVTWEELCRAPDAVPEWFAKMVKGIKMSDHLGDVWDSLISYAPDGEIKQWVETMGGAEYDDRTDRYHTDA